MSRPDGTVEVRRQPDGRWRWQWYATTEGTTSPPEPLISNEAYEERDQAVESAREAFPEAELRGDDEDDDDPGHPTARRRGRRLLLALVAATAFAAGRVAAHVADRRKSRPERVATTRTGTGPRRVDRPARRTRRTSTRR